MTKKRNIVLYLDAELVTKTRELGFNLSKTFENHLKMLINQFQNIYTQNNCGKCGFACMPIETIHEWLNEGEILAEKIGEEQIMDI